MGLKYKEVFVALAAIEFETVLQFYSYLLEKQPELYIPNVYAEFCLSGLKIGLFNPQKSHHSEFLQVTKSSMSLCFEVDNLEEAIAHLTQIGYPPSEVIMLASHGREIYVYDPAGNRLILHQAS